MERVVLSTRVLIVFVVQRCNPDIETQSGLPGNNLKQILSFPYGCILGV